MTEYTVGIVPEALELIEEIRGWWIAIQLGPVRWKVHVRLRILRELGGARIDCEEPGVSRRPTGAATAAAARPR